MPLYEAIQQLVRSNGRDSTAFNAVINELYSAAKQRALEIESPGDKTAISPIQVFPHLEQVFREALSGAVLENKAITGCELHSVSQSPLDDKMMEYANSYLWNTARRDFFYVSNKGIKQKIAAEGENPALFKELKVLIKIANNKLTLTSEQIDKIIIARTGHELYVEQIKQAIQSWDPGITINAQEKKDIQEALLINITRLVTTQQLHQHAIQIDGQLQQPNFHENLERYRKKLKAETSGNESQIAHINRQIEQLEQVSKDPMQISTAKPKWQQDFLHQLNTELSNMNTSVLSGAASTSNFIRKQGSQSHIFTESEINDALLALDSPADSANSIYTHQTTDRRYNTLIDSGFTQDEIASDEAMKYELILWKVKSDFESVIHPSYDPLIQLNSHSQQLQESTQLTNDKKTFQTQLSQLAKPLIQYHRIRDKLKKTLAQAEGIQPQADQQLLNEIEFAKASLDATESYHNGEINPTNLYHHTNDLKIALTSLNAAIQSAIILAAPRSEDNGDLSTASALDNDITATASTATRSNASSEDPNKKKFIEYAKQLSRCNVKLKDINTSDAGNVQQEIRAIIAKMDALYRVNPEQRLPEFAALLEKINSELTQNSPGSDPQPAVEIDSHKGTQLTPSIQNAKNLLDYYAAEAALKQFIPTITQDTHENHDEIRKDLNAKLKSIQEAKAQFLSLSQTNQDKLKELTINLKNNLLDGEYEPALKTLRHTVATLPKQSPFKKIGQDILSLTEEQTKKTDIPRHQLTSTLKVANKTIKNPTDGNAYRCVEQADKLPAHKSSSKLRGALMILGGLALIAASVLVALGTFGGAGPLSVLGTIAGTTLITAGIAAGVGLAGGSGAAIATKGFFATKTHDPLKKKLIELHHVAKPNATPPSSQQQEEQRSDDEENNDTSSPD